MNKPCRILVPTNFSVRSGAALDYAAALAGRVGASIDVLHVRELQAAAPGRGPRARFFADSDEGVAMEQVLSRRRRGRVEVRGRVEFGELADTIARVVAADRFDLVVMGQSGRARSSRSGDATRDVAHKVGCPVVAVNATMDAECGGSPSPEALHRAGDDAPLPG